MWIMGDDQIRKCPNHFKTVVIWESEGGPGISKTRTVTNFERLHCGKNAA